MARIILIKPNIGRAEHSLYVDEGRMEPLPLAMIAALTGDQHEVTLFDDRMEPVDFDQPADLVGITVEAFTARRSYEIAAEFRRRGIPVILGGIHVNLLPEEAQQHGDALFLGDAEFLWHEVLHDLENNKLKKVYRSEVGIQPCGVFPLRKIYQKKGYLPLTLLQFGRGCPFDCSFCAVTKYFDKRHYIRRIDEILKEIHGQKRKLLFFVDDNIIANPRAAKELFRELIPLKKRWVSQASIDMTNDLELMDLMMQSGCLGNVVGFESITQDSLKEMHKGPSLGHWELGFKDQVKILRDFGHQTWAAFTIGFDNDTRESILETEAFARRNKFSFAAFNILMPYPGTPLYEKYKAENRLLYDGTWWLHPEYRFNHAAFKPKNMTADELTEVAFEVRSRFNSLGSIFSRAFDLKTNMRSLYRFGVYMAYNPLFRKETFKKQGMLLGKNR